MKINLRFQKGEKTENKTFETGFVSGRLLRKTLEISEGVDFNRLKSSELDTLVDFVVEAYDKKFTRDEFYDGVESHELIPTIMGTLDGIISGVQDVTKDDGEGDEKN